MMKIMSDDYRGVTDSFLYNENIVLAHENYAFENEVHHPVPENDCCVVLDVEIVMKDLDTLNTSVLCNLSYGAIIYLFPTFW